MVTTYETGTCAGNGVFRFDTNSRAERSPYKG